ncbi:MAG: Hsp20/alpha crystallin family protein [Nitrospiraceae bacterium]|nr:Hsp20/alpha crystallin family protein [Nitrospiraceae bacterium]
MMTEAHREAAARRICTPAVDIIRRKDDLELVADMPGVDDKTLDVMVEKNTLTISGKALPESEENLTLKSSEYGIGDYKRVFTISEEIDRDRIQASVKNGVLRITLPKAEAVKSRKIAVAAAD